MTKEVVSGVVRKIKTIDDCISVVTLVRQDSNVEYSLPVYMKITDKYKGKKVDITNETKGLLGAHFKQTFKCGKQTKSIEISTVYLNMIKESYKNVIE